MTQTITTTRTPNQRYNANRSTPQTQAYAPRSAPQEQGYYPSSHAAPQHRDYIPRNNTTSQPQDSAPHGDNTFQRQEYAPPMSSTTPQRQDYTSRNNATPQLQGSAPRKSAVPQGQEYIARNNDAGFRPLNEEGAQRVLMSQPYRGDSSSNRRSNPYDSPNPQDEDDAGLARQNSIPRKQIGTSSNTPSSSVQASSPQRAPIGHSRQQSTPKPLPPTPAAVSREYTDRQTDSAPQTSSILNRSRPIPTSQAGLRDPQDIVDRAKTNTYDTDVVETVAPGQPHSPIVNF